MTYTVGNRTFKTLQEAKQYCDTSDFNYDLIIPMNDNIVKEENTIVIEPKTKQGRPTSVNTAKELNNIIHTAKREINNWVNTGMDRQVIFAYIEDVKKDCVKYDKMNQTCRNIYSSFLHWLNKIDKILYPEFY
jgi:hypothetical protein